MRAAMKVTTRLCPSTTTFLMKKESRSGIEPRPLCFKPAHKPSCRPPLVITLDGAIPPGHAHRHASFTSLRRISHSQTSININIKPVLNWANVCSPEHIRTLRRTMIRFLIELLVRRIWFGQSKLYFILNWLVMRCKFRPELAADRMIENVG